MGFSKILLSYVVLLNITTDYWTMVMTSIVDADLTLSLKEKKALEKFTEIMQDSLTQDYMKSDIYLIKWLRAGELDLDRAEHMLNTHLEWRKDLNVDSILNEDFLEIEREFPVDIEGVDLNGSPILTIETEDWDLRRGILSGKGAKIQRYLLNRFEAIISKIRQAQDNGKNVTRLHLLDNLQGYNLIQHACIQLGKGFKKHLLYTLEGMPIQIRLLNDLQTQYPGMVHNIVYINAPSTIEFALRILLPLASDELRKGMKIFGSNKAEWQAYLFAFVAPDQLFQSFGGTRVHT